MPDYTAIVRGLPLEKFVEVFAASARRAREAYFQRHGIRKPKTLSGLPKAGATAEARTAALFQALQGQDDEKLVEEVLRTWLLTKRPMLAAALDHLEIPHDNGITDVDDLDRFTTLDAGELATLAARLAETAPRDEVAIYLKFMGAKNVDAAMGADAAAASWDPDPNAGTGERGDESNVCDDRRDLRTDPTTA
jgi:hypothetical protein